MSSLFWQFFRFCVTGTINTVVDFIVYLGLTRSFAYWENHLVLATGISFVVASTNSYVMNKYWTFKDKFGKHVIQYPKFITVALIGLSINVGLFYVFVHLVHINDIASKVLVAGVVLFWNYLANKLWTFSIKNSEQNTHAI